MRSMAALKINMTLTLVLMFMLMLGIMVLLGLFYPLPPIFFLIFPFIIVLFQWGVGPYVVKKATRLRYLAPGELPWLEMAVGELSRQAGVHEPKLAVVDNPSPNAFVFGRSAKSSTMAVHPGLLNKLNREEIRAVIAHELGHLKHKDVVVMTVVGVIPLLAFMASRFLLWGGILGRRRNDSGAMIAMGFMFIIIYFISQMIVLRLSRQREYYADAFSADLTGQPMDLASALTKISLGLSLSKKNSDSARSFYIGDPATSKREIASIKAHANEYDLNGDGVIDEYELKLAMEKEGEKQRGRGIVGLFSTHPSTFARIKALKYIEKETRGY